MIRISYGVIWAGVVYKYNTRKTVEVKRKSEKSFGIFGDAKRRNFTLPGGGQVAVMLQVTILQPIPYALQHRELVDLRRVNFSVDKRK